MTSLHRDNPLVTKTIEAAELAGAVRRVATGDAVFSPSLAGFVLDAFAGEGPDPAEVDPELARLTEREREVLHLIAAATSARRRLRSWASRPRRSSITSRRSEKASAQQPPPTQPLGDRAPPRRLSGLDGDRGDEAKAVCVDLDVRDGVACVMLVTVPLIWLRALIGMKFLPCRRGGKLTVEMAAGQVVALSPRFGGLLVAGWLAGIIVSLLLVGGYADTRCATSGCYRRPGPVTPGQRAQR